MSVAERSAFGVLKNASKSVATSAYGIWSACQSNAETWFFDVVQGNLPYVRQEPFAVMLIARALRL